MRQYAARTETSSKSAKQKGTSLYKEQAAHAFLIITY